MRTDHPEYNLAFSVLEGEPGAVIDASLENRLGPLDLFYVQRRMVRV